VKNLALFCHLASIGGCGRSWWRGNLIVLLHGCKTEYLVSSLVDRVMIDIDKAPMNRKSKSVDKREGKPTTDRLDVRQILAVEAKKGSRAMRLGILQAVNQETVPARRFSILQACEAVFRTGRARSWAGEGKPEDPSEIVREHRGLNLRAKEDSII